LDKTQQHIHRTIFPVLEGPPTKTAVTTHRFGNKKRPKKLGGCALTREVSKRGPGKPEENFRGLPKGKEQGGARSGHETKMLRQHLKKNSNPKDQL